MNNLYNMIFKRKSIRKYDSALSITESELKKIEEQLNKLIPLVDNIYYKFVIVKRELTTAKFGEYCLLFYSEKKSNYLLNAGFMLEQMDLFMTSLDIGVCWYALAKPLEYVIDKLDYVIMLAFGKSRPQDFRNNISKFNRKKNEEIWEGIFDKDVIDTVRLAPSSCNTQPWKIISENNNITVYRNTLIKSFIPKTKLPYYNSIDIGIFLCFLEISLLKKNYLFTRNITNDENSNLEIIEVSKYIIKS